jgi:tetratricopeptide (TPR) repeat protein
MQDFSQIKVGSDSSRLFERLKGLNGSFVESLPVLLLSVLFFGCSSVPDEELTAAQEALDQARETEADVYVPEEFQKATDDFEAAQAAIAEENQKSFYSRDYDEARRLLEQAESSAEEAAAAAPINKQQVRDQAEQALQNASAAFEEAEQNLETAPGGKGTQPDLEALRSDLQRAESALEEGRRNFQSEAYLEALEKLQGAMEGASEVSEAIEAVR